MQHEEEKSINTNSHFVMKERKWDENEAVLTEARVKAFTSLPIKKTNRKIPSVHMTSPKSDTCVANMHSSEYHRCSKFSTNHMLNDLLKLN
jgi:hypothetical protein